MFYNKIKKFALIATILLTLVHAIEVRSNIYKSLNVEKNVEKIDFNNKPMKLSFSQDKPNVFIFLMDAFPGDMVEKFLKKYPNLKSELDGFTYYKNTVSTGTYSVVSASGVLGGNNYTLDKLVSNYKELYKGMEEAYSVIPKNFKGYDIDFVVPPYIRDEAKNKIQQIYGVDFFDEYTVGNMLFDGEITTYKALDKNDL